MDADQALAWKVLVDLDQLDVPWTLVGGDVVVDVWTHRDAIRTTGRWLEHKYGFVLVETADGFAYLVIIRAGEAIPNPRYSRKH